MIPVRPQDARHKAWLLRVLTEIVDNPLLSQNLYFKGGTCASMLGFLDRFSVDLDFDLKTDALAKEIRVEFGKIFKNLGLNIKDQSKKVPEFFVRYESPKNERSIIKIDAFGMVYKANKYASQFLPEINRMVNCQTVETMVANKLVAITDRFEKNGSIAGRDLYDIHYFFMNGYGFNGDVITERTGLTAEKYFKKLVDFIEKNVTETIINEDLNTLLRPEVFNKIRKVLKQVVITYITSQYSH